MEIPLATVFRLFHVLTVVSENSTVPKSSSFRNQLKISNKLGIIGSAPIFRDMKFH